MHDLELLERTCCTWESQTMNGFLFFYVEAWALCSFAHLFRSSSTLALAYGLLGSIVAVWQWKEVTSLLTTLWRVMVGFKEEHLQQYVVLHLAVDLFTSVFGQIQQWILISQQFAAWFIYWKWNWKPVLTGGKWNLLALCVFCWFTPAKQRWISVCISNSFLYVLFKQHTLFIFPFGGNMITWVEEWGGTVPGSVWYNSHIAYPNLTAVYLRGKQLRLIICRLSKRYLPLDSFWTWIFSPACSICKQK